jgi:hypothetical protein
MLYIFRLLLLPSPLSHHPNAFFNEMVKSPFFAYASALNSQPRLFIYFIFIPSANPQHNLTKHKKRFWLGAPNPSLGERTATESLFLYLSIISFDEAKCVRHGKFVLCVMKMPKPFFCLLKGKQG